MIISKLVAATVAGGVFGAGALALTPSLAASGDPSDSTSGAHQHAGKQHRHGLALGRARHVLHAQWTTRDDQEHRAIRGTVTAVSASSVTVRAKDDVTQTYVVTAKTKVRVRDGQKGLDSIGEVTVGDRALVVGTGPRDAVRVLARTPKKTSQGD